MILFARGVPAPECLPVEELADCARAVLERDGVGVLSYGPGGGYGPLREWLAARPGVGPRRAPRGRARPRAAHERLAAGLRLPGRDPRRARRARARRGTHLRPAAEDPRPARRRRRGAAPR